MKTTSKHTDRNTPIVGTHLDIHTKRVYSQRMIKTASHIRKRVNITISNGTLRLLDRVAPKGDRSQVIDEAVRAFISGKSRASLRERLKEGAKARASRGPWDL
jgi:hypothetical protein